MDEQLIFLRTLINELRNQRDEAIVEAAAHKRVNRDLTARNAWLMNELEARDGVADHEWLR